MDAYQLASAYARYTNKCIFLTGKAGTGKTTFLRNLQVQSNKQMAIIAPTGVAAINAGGSTIHSFFQLPPQLFLPTDEARRFLFSEMQIRKQKIQVFKNLELLIIDEISMVRADLLDAIDAILRHYRHINLPFGGVQLLMIGDLFQLSPVAREYEWDRLRPFYNGPYFFNARVFAEVQPIYIELDHVFRQTNQDFVDILNQVRNNCLTAQSRKLLNSRYQPDYQPGKDGYHIILSTHNQKVDSINQRELDQLKGKEYHFSADIEGTFPESLYPIDAQLTLKVGARVMFVKNNKDSNYYNGKLGIVKELNQEHIVVESEGEDIIVDRETWPNIRYSAGTTSETLIAEEIGHFNMFPLRLAWAITIHKSQGLTFDDVVIDAADAFAAGQVYVALSRCRTLEGIILLSQIPDSALNNALEVLRYTAAQPGIEAINQMLPNAELNYLIITLTSLFDFRDAIRRTESLIRLTGKDAAFSQPTAEWLDARKGEMEELQKVGELFQNQIRQYLNSGQDLSERIIAAAGYFTPKIATFIAELKQSPCTTDNKEARASFEEIINELNLDICRKHHLVKEVAKEPHLEGYFKARSSFRLPPYFISASSEKVNQDDSPTGELLRALFRRRKAIASDAGVEIYYVAKNDSLKEIAQKLPTTKRELMKVSGFGQVKYNIWGDEIIKMVKQFLLAHPEVRQKPSAKELYLQWKEQQDKKSQK